MFFFLKIKYPLKQLQTVKKTKTKPKKMMSIALIFPPTRKGVLMQTTKAAGAIKTIPMILTKMFFENCIEIPNEIPKVIAIGRPNKIKPKIQASISTR